jgi:Cu-Zn family superoxide dismutase
MVGHVGATSLAAAGLALVIFNVLLLFGIGVSFAITPLVASAQGANDTTRITEVLRHGLVINFITSLLLVGVVSVGKDLLYHLGQSETVVSLSIPYLRIAEEHTGGHADMWNGVTKAIAVLMPTDGNEAHGVVRFEQMPNGVQVTADVAGLAPGTRHGFHVHEKGDCSTTDGSSAGGHYSPEGHPHGLPDTDGPRHAGDMGNLVAGPDGVAHLEQLLTGATVAGMNAPLLGRGVIVHAERDNGGQPTGNAGARSACGVIGVTD